MKYINNWITTLTAPLAAGGAALPIDPVAASRLDPLGTYRLTLANSAIPTLQTQIEIIDVSDGVIISRANEGTVAQSWSAGTLVYCALTAGQIDSIMSRLDALESATPPAPSDGLTDENGNTLTDENSNILIGE